MPFSVGVRDFFFTNDVFAGKQRFDDGGAGGGRSDVAFLHCRAFRFVFNLFSGVITTRDRHPVQVYYNHLGELKYSKRSPITNGAGDIEGMYYFKRLGLLLFYNKLKEQRDKGQAIPELYQNRNVLRYEQRYQKNLAKSFNVERVTAVMLFDEAFYINVKRFFVGWLRVAPVVSSSCAGIGFFAVINSYGELKLFFGENTYLFVELKTN
jgi:hypothetical protein